MLGTIARAAYVITVATLIVAWAMSPGRSTPVEPPKEQPVWQWNI
jgi:hypothetical protein